MQKIEEIINNLKTKPQIDAVFLTGSYGSDHKPYSDIDMVVILNKHEHDLTSLYTWIDDTFADIFFFDIADLERIELAKEISGNKMDGVFISWLTKASVQFDKSGKLTNLITNVGDLSKKLTLSKEEKESFWRKVNYNYICNKRYFDSQDPLYHEALEIRLLYSVSEVFTGYFEFRDIVWRGEKAALKYLKAHDERFYKAFISYAQAAGIKEKFERYTSLVELVFPDSYKKWEKGEVFPQVKNWEKADMQKLIGYWNDLIG